MSADLNENWIAARVALHASYEAVEKIDEASRLAYLHGTAPRSFSLEEVRALWSEALARPASRAATRNQVYVHVPFCKSLCTFCNYERLKPSSPDLLEAWLARVLGSLEALGPTLAPLEFDSLYLGGGTPSVLTPDLFERLLSALGRGLRWHPQSSRHVEFDPQVMSRDKLEVLARHGFSRFSFGIESLDPEVTRLHERGVQTRETIAKRFAELEQLGIDHVACDFLAGLAGTTPDVLLAEIEEIATKHRPARIDVYMLTPTESYVTKAFGGDAAAFWAHYARFDRAIPEGVRAIGARHGYGFRGGGGHHHRLERVLGSGKTRPAFAYAPTLSAARAPVHLVGFGPSARSQIFGYGMFSARDPAHDRASPEPTYFEGHRIDLASECRSLLVHHFRDHDEMTRDELRQIVGVDFEEVFPQAIAVWARLGLARLDARSLRFVPQERHDRTRALLWLVPEPALEHEIARHRGLDVSDAGVRSLVAELNGPRALAGGWRFGGVRDARILLEAEGQETVPVRVAPSVEGRGLRLVSERTAPEDHVLARDLARSVRALERLLGERYASGLAARRRRLTVT